MLTRQWNEQLKSMERIFSLSSGRSARFNGPFPPYKDRGWSVGVEISEMTGGPDGVVTADELDELADDFKTLAQELRDFVPPEEEAKSTWDGKLKRLEKTLSFFSFKGNS
jgi:hypothetical protein